MRRSLRWLIVVVLLMAPGLSLLAERVATLPAPTGYVSDLAGVLSPETRQSVEALCTEVDRQAHAQIAVVTVKSIEDDKGGETSIEEFASHLEEKWKVGAKGTDRGVLMLLVMPAAGSTVPKGRIEVGYGLEGILPDARVGDIGREMAPLAQKGDYNAAVPLGVKDIAQVIATDAGVTLEGAPVVHQYHRVAQRQPVQLSLFQVLLFGGVGLVILVVLIRTGNVGVLFWLLMNMVGGSGGGGRDRDDRGGGGFGGFGGGGSGGGGASGDF